MTDSTLPDLYPLFVPDAAGLVKAKERLADAYHDYTTHVSPPEMAIGLETAAYVLWASEQYDVRSAVDFGSGFTSYVLRLVCDDVVSVDDSPEWLAWTGRFLKRHHKPKGTLSIWDEYRTQTSDTHDLVVYDFSCGRMRDENFDFAIGQIAPGGIAVLDDANHQGHQNSMRLAAMHYRYDLFGLQDWTRDFYRRFAALIVAP